MRRKLFSWHCFTHFPNTTAPQNVIFSGKLSTIIIFKLCKFSVNLWTLYFFVLQKLHRPFTRAITQPPLLILVQKLVVLYQVLITLHTCCENQSLDRWAMTMVVDEPMGKYEVNTYRRSFFFSRRRTLDKIKRAHTWWKLC